MSGRSVLRVAARSTAGAGKQRFSLVAKAFFGSPNIKSPYTHGAHRSNAEALVNTVPVVEVDGHIAVCTGGGGALGHPAEYIQLDTVSKEPAICKYCGLRFKASGHSHHH